MMKKPIIHYTFVLAVVAIVCGIMISAVNAITAPIIENNILKAQAAAYQLVLPSGETFTEVTNEEFPATVLTVVEAKAGTNVVGYIYTSYTTNKYGYMRLVVAVGSTGTILGADFIDINQTYQVDGTRTNLSLYVGSAINSITPSGDIVTGATGSLNSLKGLLADVAIAHALVVVAPADPYEAWFGAGYSMEIDSTFVPTTQVLEKSIVRNASDEVIGSYYHLRGTAEYNSEQGSAGTINMYVGLSSTGEILGIDLPKDEYGHTTSNAFYPKVIAYANSIAGSNIESFSGQGDLATGSTNSKNLIDTLLTALGGVIE
jgi:Na+-translocating ferredoxin:NAD+ oxidoreductase RnfG subunit